MPEIEIRPAIEVDIPLLVQIDHSYTSDHVWQMEPHYAPEQTGAIFREVRLPRTAKVDYPRSVQSLSSLWKTYSGMLVAVHSSEPVGYITLAENVIPLTTWAIDLVVQPQLRRKGIGTALILAALEWTESRKNSHRLMLGVQPKNFPGINLALRLGFDFCGYIDHYFPNRDIAIFFTKWII